jgi:hypothetical protein
MMLHLYARGRDPPSPRRSTARRRGTYPGVGFRAYAGNEEATMLYMRICNSG